MGNWITSFGALIGFDTTKLSTINDETDMFNDSILTNQKNKDLKHLALISKETPELDNKLVDVKSSNYVNNLFYTILTFIMIITIILLVLYRLNTNAIISDRFMIIYFIAIVILFMFIRFILNK
jgi:K+-sensing histidine kinase KdpD